MTSRARATLAHVVLASLVVLLVTGCAGRLNDRPVLDGSVAIPSVTPPLPPVAENPAERWSGPGPATTSLDRADWQQQTFMVPVDGTTHGPVYATRTELRGTDVERRGGLYPTPQSALDLAGDQPERVILDTFRAYADSFFDLAMFFPRTLALEPLWSEHQSPRVRYQRRPADDWRVGPLPASADQPYNQPDAQPDDQPGDQPNREQADPEQ